MNEDYIPRPGDWVRFPGAPLERNRTRDYIITEVQVWFRASTEQHAYRKTLTELRDIGMRLIMSVDAQDPTKDES